jgi:hypothetical protein
LPVLRKERAQTDMGEGTSERNSDGAKRRCGASI